MFSQISRIPNLLRIFWAKRWGLYASVYGKFSVAAMCWMITHMNTEKVIGDVLTCKMCSNLCMFGKNSWSNLLITARTALLGRSWSAFSHLHRKQKSSTSKIWCNGRSSAYYCKTACTGFPSQETSISRQSIVIGVKVSVYLRNTCKMIQYGNCVGSFVVILRCSCFNFASGLLPINNMWHKWLNVYFPCCGGNHAVTILHVAGCLPCFCCQCPSFRQFHRIDLQIATQLK